MVNTKKCTKCGIEKELTEFYKDKSKKDGVKTQCKVCCSEAKREYRQRPDVREHSKQRNKEYYSQNRTEIRQRQKEHYQKNREAILKQQKEYEQRPENKERIKQYKKEYKKEYYKQNRKEIIQSQHK